MTGLLHKVQRWFYVKGEVNMKTQKKTYIFALVPFCCYVFCLRSYRSFYGHQKFLPGGRRHGIYT